MITMKHIIPVVALLCITPHVCFCTAVGSGVFQISKVDLVLHEFMETSEEDRRENIMVEFQQGPDSILNSFHPSGFSTMEDMHGAYVQECKLMQRESQMELKSYLDGNGFPHQSFWVNNRMYVPNANAEMIRAISSFDDVRTIRPEEVFHIDKPFHDGPVEERPFTANNDASINAAEWNIEKVQAPATWDKFSTGSGCSIGVIDTGVRPTHQALMTSSGDSRVVDWLDAVNAKPTAYDDNGHGTHCCGTMAGRGGIGVAPEATIIGCKACSETGGCTEKCITDCCQWMTQKKPQVVSNSWGGPGGSSTYSSILSAWNSMGMVAVFSAGNSGPSCTTMGSPGDNANAISVGSCTMNNTLSGFSSRGPCKSGMFGPTVTAPGSNIRSAWTGSDTSYKAISGTSMACPHVSGMIALMKSRNPSLSVSQIRSILIASCVNRGLVDPNQTCGGTSVNDFPDNMYGHGLMNCANAFTLMEQIKANDATSDEFTVFATKNDITSIIK